jgi:hypothetical protein
MVADDDGAEPGARTEIAEQACLVESTGRVARVRDALLEARTVRSLMLSVVGGGEMALGVCWGLAGIYTLLDVFGEYLSSCRGLWVHSSAAYTHPNSAVLASAPPMALFFWRWSFYCFSVPSPHSQNIWLHVGSRIAVAGGLCVVVYHISGRLSESHSHGSLFLTNRRQSLAALEIKIQPEIQILDLNP